MLFRRSKRARRDEFLCIYPFPQEIPVSIEPESIAHVGRDRHAVDFLVPEGTPVLAPHDGFVIEVKQDSTVGGPDEHFADHANYVVLGRLLPGETVASTLMVGRADPRNSILIHLQAGSVTVRRNQIVQAGQPIARQGSTGWTYAPHIHIAAYKDGDTVPIRFQPRKRGFKKWW